MQTIEFRFECDNRVNLDISIDPIATIDFDLTDTIQVVESSYPIYDGPYTIIPKATDQSVPTEETLVMEDILVKRIPTYATSNPHGGLTFIIG